MNTRLSACAMLAFAVLLGSCADGSDGPMSPNAAHVIAPVLADAAAPLVRISEIHYDNDGTDAGEAIEISGPAGTDLTGWQIVLYNGSVTSGAMYDTRTLAGMLAAACGERGVIVESYPSNGIQNGEPDGIALVNAAGAVVEFISYEGTFTAVNGPATGMLSVDIGVSEAGSTPAGLSLQRDSANTWSAPAAQTFGACNDGASNTPPPDDGEDEPPPTSAPATRFSEIHYDNVDVDVGEAIEIEGPAGMSVNGWSIVLYNQTGGAMYSTTVLSGTFADQCDGRGTLVVRYPSNGIQNGGRDGMALVNASGSVIEFLSYELTLTATDGPAAGLTSRDIGVFESSTTPVGYSLQRRPDGLSWASRAPNSFGACFGQPPVEPEEPTASISFSGRNAFDVPLPVGFEDQLFATLRGGDGVEIATTFTWASETPDIATVDADGVIHAVSAGMATLRATAADGTTATWTLPTQVAALGTSAQYGNNAEFGEPADADASDDFIVRRAQYTASFSNVRNTPNWVSYNLDASHIGTQDRCDCFTYDPALPAGNTGYTTADYTGAGEVAGYGIDRGHLARSFDRTTGALDNATTFYFSNIIPQAADNNQGPWSAMENDLGDLARFSDRELYIVAGVAGTKGTVKNEGLIVIPAAVWKVALVLPRDAGLASVDSWNDVEAIAAIMPNDAGIRNVDWHTYATTVDAVEALSGYDLFALLRDDIELAVESGTQPPSAAVDGPYAAYALDPVNMSAASSTDGDGDALTFAWDFGDGSSAAVAGVTHTYAAAGTYDVRLIVTDVLGLADTTFTTATMTNMPPAVAIERAMGMLDGLVSSGAISGGNANAVTSKLDAAASQVDKGNESAASGQLGAAINQLDAMVRSGRLSAAEAAAIRTMLQRAIDGL